MYVNYVEICKCFEQIYKEFTIYYFCVTFRSHRSSPLIHILNSYIENCTAWNCTCIRTYFEKGLYIYVFCLLHILYSICMRQV
jgi:hypothetical protein